MKYLKRITGSTWLLTLVSIFGTLIGFYLKRTTILNLILWTSCVIGSIWFIQHELRCNINVYKLIGTINTHVNTFDIDYDSFVSYMGRKPTNEDKSRVYINLYSIHEIPITNKLKRACKNHRLIKLSLNDTELIEIKRTSKYAPYKYNGFESHEFFTKGDINE